ncbi:hypothetical protein SAY86_028017 [Trapa natans]|uniref:C2H2-type domain-containing protein n=1 Tax=Trapa natans TaxID=22666 RepID=A0AAN7RD12_TRANT|nr:hypothetical protein SAY86_028017 [Trapa natans]
MQKIQAIKMIVGIFICSVRHCLKSYMKKSEFEAHIYESHYHILYPNAEEGIESEEQSQKGHSATDSTAGAPPRQIPCRICQHHLVFPLTNLREELRSSQVVCTMWLDKFQSLGPEAVAELGPSFGFPPSGMNLARGYPTPWNAKKKKGGLHFKILGSAQGLGDSYQSQEISHETILGISLKSFHVGGTRQNIPVHMFFIPFLQCWYSEDKKES